MTDARNNNPADQLDRYLDNLAMGTHPQAGEIDEPTAWALEQIWRLDTTRGPRPEFAESLRLQLGGAVPAAPRRIPRQWIRRVDLAAVAALLIAMVVITMVAIINENAKSPAPTPDLGQVGAPSATAGLQPTPVPNETARPSGTEAPEESPMPDHTPPPSETLTPVGPTPEATATPPVFLGGDFPEFTSLTQLVNASDLIVIGYLVGGSDPDQKVIYSATFFIEQVLRGDAEPGTEIEIGSIENVPAGESMVLFLNASHESNSPAYTRVLNIGGNDIVRLNPDGTIVPRDPHENGLLNIAHLYANQHVDDLARDIAAIPPIEPGIEDLLTGAGWDSIGRTYHQVVSMPAIDRFSEERPLRYHPATWQDALDQSQRSGFDFSWLAGNDVELMTWYLEQPRADGERLIRAIILLHEQQIVGIWIIDSYSQAVFGLNDRNLLLGIPPPTPTPEPTATEPIPQGETVNPVARYDLANTSYLMLCWPWCDNTAESEEFRQQIVAALDQNLRYELPEVQPTPTQDYEVKQPTGEYIVLTFWQGEPLQSPRFNFGYDRLTGKILLPEGEGWIAAPDGLERLLADIEPPQPPSKE